MWRDDDREQTNYERDNCIVFDIRIYMDELLKANVGYQGLETRRLDGRKVKIVIVLCML